MHVGRFALAAAMTLVLPALGFSQTTAYVCTPQGQVLKQAVNADGSPGVMEVLYTGTGGFDDCVVGPDGWLYIASGAHILRLDPSSAGSAAASAAYLSGTPLPSHARSLAFNVSTLYVNTASSGVWTLAGSAGAVDPLTFSAPPSPLLAVSPAGGHGIAFDVLGNLAVASGNHLLRTTVSTAPPHYPGMPAPVFASGATVFGVAINTCGEVVFAEKATQSLRRRLKDGTIAAAPVVSFAGTADYPIAIEIDSSNNIYIVTAQSDDGAKGKLWRAAPVVAAGAHALASCATARAGLLLDLKAAAAVLPVVKSATLSTNDTGELAEEPSTNPVSTSALGLAIDRTNVSLTHSFDAANCSRLYDFGYHTVRLSFDNCSVPFTLTIDALKSKPSEVGFTFDLSARGVPYSPLGGHVIQYILNEPLGADGANPFPFQATYGFYSQAVMGMPGVARALSHAATDPFTENVTSDFWDVGVLDAAGGERGNEFSKRVIFNARPEAASCTVPVFDKPLHHGQPLFNSGQNIKIAFTPAAADGSACGAGGTLRVSVVRIEDSDGNQVLDFMPVRSTSSKSGNNMTVHGKTYSFGLDSQGYPSGTYLITVWGDTVAPATKIFEIEK